MFSGVWKNEGSGRSGEPIEKLREIFPSCKRGEMDEFEPFAIPAMHHVGMAKTYYILLYIVNTKESIRSTISNHTDVVTAFPLFRFPHDIIHFADIPFQVKFQ